MMRFQTKITVFLAAGLAAQVALADFVDLRLTLQAAEDVDHDMDRVYCDVLLSKVALGPGGPPQRSRSQGRILQRESSLLPESRRGGSKIYTSHTVKGDDDLAVWNDTIVLRNVPDDADLVVRLWERHSLRPKSWIGDATVDLRASGVLARVGADMDLREEIVVDRLFRSNDGDMKVRIVNLGSHGSAYAGTYRDGPIKWRRYHSKTVEFITAGIGNLLSGKKGHYLYSIDLHRSEEAFKGVRAFATESTRIIVEANRAVTGTALTEAVRLHHGFVNGFVNGEEPGNAGEVYDARGFFDVFNWGRGTKGKGLRFTYVVRDGVLRFTRTGSSTRRDFASKHFMLADGNRDVFMAGEMFVVPADRVPASVVADVVGGGYTRSHNGPHLTNAPSLPSGASPVPEGTRLPVLVVDNASGTYAPEKWRLPVLVGLLQYNFPGMNVLPVAFDDPRMAELKLAAGVAE